MDKLLDTHYVFEVIQAASLFLETIEHLHDLSFRQAHIVSNEFDCWKLEFSGFYTGETFAREIILHVEIPSLNTKLISDERIR